MQPVSDLYLASRATGCVVGVRATLSTRTGGVLVDNLPLVDASTTLDPPGGPRRSLTASLPGPGAVDYRADLATPGCELSLWHTNTYPDGSVEEVAGGVFPIDEDTVSWGQAGTIDVTAGDRWWLLQQARFVAPRSTRGPVVDVIRGLVQEAIPGQVVRDFTTRVVQSAQAVWDQDRTEAITTLADAAGFDAAFDAHGDFIIRDAPSLTDPVAWEVRPGDGGVMLPGTTESRRRRDIFNVAVVRDTRADDANWGQAVARNTDPLSPWRVDLIGERPRYFSTGVLTNATSALYAAQQYLKDGVASAARVALVTTPHHGLEYGDVLRVVYPEPVGARTELRMVSGWSAPAGAGTQNIETRFSEPEGE